MPRPHPHELAAATRGERTPGEVAGGDRPAAQAEDRRREEAPAPSRRDRLRGLLSAIVPSSPPPPSAASRYDQAFDRVFSRLSVAATSLEQDRESAPLLLTGLLAAPAEGRTLLIRNSRRFQSWALADLLLRQSRAAWNDDPFRAEELATLALQVAESLDTSRGREPVVHDLTARAWSYIANARRIASQPQRAEEAFRQAEKLLAQGTGDPLEQARLLDLQASLHRDQRRLEEATHCLDQALAAYRRAGEEGLASRALIKKTIIWREDGHPGRGIPLLQRLAQQIDGERDPNLLLSIQHNLVMALNESGRSEEAQVLLPTVRKLALQLGTRLDLLRLRWLDGLVAANLGQDTRAEWSLRAARDGYLRLGLTSDVAIISLDLAAFYLRRGRTQETRRLAAEIVPLFQAQEVHREALAAMLLFAEAAERETLTLRSLGEIARRLEKIGSRGRGPREERS